MYSGGNMQDYSTATASKMQPSDATTASNSSPATGFHDPHSRYTITPNQFFDEVMRQGHPPCVQIIVSILMRATQGWINPHTQDRCAEVAMSLRDFARLGLCVSSARKGLALAIQAGYVVQTREATNKVAARYALCWQNRQAQVEAIARQREAGQDPQKPSGVAVMEPLWKRQNWGDTLQVAWGVTSTGLNVRGVNATPPLIKENKPFRKENKDQQTNQHAAPPSPAVPTRPSVPEPPVIAPVIEATANAAAATEDVGLLVEFQSLISCGFSQKAAKDALREHGAVRCQEVLAHVSPECDSTVRRTRWAQKALAEGWTLTRLQEQREREAAQAQQRAEAEARAQERQQAAVPAPKVPGVTRDTRQAARARLDSLPEPERARLQEQALAQLRAELPALSRQLDAPVLAPGMQMTVNTRMAELLAASTAPPDASVELQDSGPLPFKP